MGRPGSRKRKQRQVDSQSSSSTSDSSVVKTNETTIKNVPKKTKTSTPISHQEALSKFAFKPREEENMEEKGDNCQLGLDSDDSNAAFSLDHSFSSRHRHDQGISNEDLMLKLCANGAEISKLSRTVEELKAALFTLQTENDQLKKEVSEVRKREEQMKTKVAEARHLAELADQRSEDLSGYVRRNNLRIYGVKEEESGETPQQCEDKVISLFNDKLKVKVKREDIEAVHRVGAKQGQRRSAGSSSDAKNSSRGIIVRFVSRRVRDTVLYACKGLKGSKTVLVEDLTPRAYSLLCTVKSDTSVCQQAWTKNGNVVMKANNGKIVTITSLTEFRQTDQRALWAQQINHNK